MTTVYALYLEADRISFFLFFGARKCIFIFRRFIFRPKKTSAFSFFFLFSILKWRLKKQKKEIQYFD